MIQLKLDETRLLDPTVGCKECGNPMRPGLAMSGLERAWGGLDDKFDWAYYSCDSKGCYSACIIVKKPKGYFDKFTDSILRSANVRIPLPEGHNPYDVICHELEV